MASNSDKSANGFLPLYGGDYLRDTMHLTAAEDGIYLRLLIHYWHSQRPLPDDQRKLSGIARAHSTEDAQALTNVLAEFFPLNGDGSRHNSRMDHEIEKWSSMKEAASAHGRKGNDTRWGPHRKGIAPRLPEESPRIARRMPPPVTSKTTPVASLPAPEGVSQETFSLWWASRPARGKTPGAHKFVCEQLVKFKQEGFDPEQIVATSISNGWQGLFRPDVKKGAGGTGWVPPTKAKVCARASCARDLAGQSYTRMGIGDVCSACRTLYMDSKWDGKVVT